MNSAQATSGLGPPLLHVPAAPLLLLPPSLKIHHKLQQLLARHLHRQ